MQGNEHDTIHAGKPMTEEARKCNNFIITQRLKFSIEVSLVAFFAPETVHCHELLDVDVVSILGFSFWDSCFTCGVQKKRYETIGLLC